MAISQYLVSDGEDIPYSGKIWRGIQFGELARNTKKRQIKNRRF